MTLELDLTDHTALRPQDLVRLPSQLPCGCCGTVRGRHGWTAWCPHPFERPRLPAGHRYADELVAGDRLSLLSRPDRCPEEVLAVGELRLAGHRSVQLQSRSRDGRLRTHLLDPDAIVLADR